jgi:pantoate--beta-alanine ligase
MQLINNIIALRETVSAWRKAGESVALVPTMGNLHAGHLALVEKAKKRASRVVVSIFVNPMQFSDASGSGGDFEHYPRSLDADCEKLTTSGFLADVVFAPSLLEVYPGGFEHETRIEVPLISDMLCGEFRPGHFVGVATVVAKLFNMVLPDVAVFGEKDFQQLLVIRHLSRDLCFPIDIVGLATVREQSGLAMSSRNQYLSVDERKQAAHLYQTLLQLQQKIVMGGRGFSSLQAQARAQLSEAGFRPEYVEIRCATNLRPAGEDDQALVILVAAWLGKARLIDNLSFILGDS